MKKLIVFLIAFILLISVNVYAKNLMLKVNNDGNVKTLEYYENGELISFNDAQKKYNVPSYVSLQEDNQKIYFYQGKEINESTYNIGIDEERTVNLLKKYSSYGYRVKNTDELIDTINKLFDERKAGIYHLVYSRIDIKNINFDFVENYVKDKYVFDGQINTFNYTTHGIINYPKKMFNYDDTEMIINIRPVILKEEEICLDSFLEEYIQDLANKTDYEKILFAYTYLKTTVNKNNENNSRSFSAYDAFINRRASCIGFSNAFQLIMEQIGIESYIVDDIKNMGESIISEHTFNVVSLDGNYYIIDLTKEGYNGFLIGNVEYKLSNGIIISNTPYNYKTLSIDIDYHKYEELLNDILKRKRKKENIPNKEHLENVDFISYITLIIILLFLTLVIVYFTRKER